MWKRWICLPLALCMMLTLCGCPGQTRETQKIIKTVDKAENCIHKLDIEGFLDCIDPDDTTAIRLIIWGIDQVSEEEMSNRAIEGLYQVIKLMVGAASGLPDFNAREALEASLRNVSFRATEVWFPFDEDKHTAKVNCELIIETGDNSEPFTTIVERTMVKRNGTWYIDWI